MAVVVEDELLRTDISCALLSSVPPPPPGEGEAERAVSALTLRAVFSAVPLPSMEMTVVLGEAAEDDIAHRITGLLAGADSGIWIWFTVTLYSLHR